MTIIVILSVLAAVTTPVITVASGYTKIGYGTATNSTSPTISDNTNNVNVYWMNTTIAKMNNSYYYANSIGPGTRPVIEVLKTDIDY